MANSKIGKSQTSPKNTKTTTPSTGRWGGGAAAAPKKNAGSSNNPVQRMGLGSVYPKLTLAPAAKSGSGGGGSAGSPKVGTSSQQGITRAAPSGSGGSSRGRSSGRGGSGGGGGGGYDPAAAYQNFLQQQFDAKAAQVNQVYGQATDQINGQLPGIAADTQAMQAAMQQQQDQSRISEQAQQMQRTRDRAAFNNNAGVQASTAAPIASAVGQANQAFVDTRGNGYQAMLGTLGANERGRVNAGAAAVDQQRQQALQKLMIALGLVPA